MQMFWYFSFSFAIYLLKSSAVKTTVTLIAYESTICMLTADCILVWVGWIFNKNFAKLDGIQQVSWFQTIYLPDRIMTIISSPSIGTCSRTCFANKQSGHVKKLCFPQNRQWPHNITSCSNYKYVLADVSIIHCVCNGNVSPNFWRSVNLR